MNPLLNNFTSAGILLLILQFPKISWCESTLRIHAGGGAFTDDSGHVWSPDNYFNTGGTFTTSSSIDGTVNDALYQSERYDVAGDPELTYSIPVTPGAYTVRLHFAEIYFTSPGQRAFDISIENQIVTANFDIFAQAGAKNKALVKEYDVTVADKILSIMLIHKIENPKISSIEILPRPPGTPDSPPDSGPVPLATGCIDGKWDPAYTWVKDCTPGNQYDGQFGTGTGTAVYTGETTIYAGTTPHILSWKLHYFKGNLTGSLSGSKLPLVVGLHSWTEGATVPQLLNSESSLMQYEGSWEDVIFLTVALENGNNLNTWWDGSKVNGVPTTWAMDAIVDLVNARMGDAASLLSSAGAPGLATKAVDSNRVYLHGASMGGSGTYHIGLRHPELFAAVHAHAGFADYDGGPCGTEAFCTSFTNNFIGTVAENLQMKGLDGKNYPARSYSNMSWFAGVHNGASWTASLGKGKPYEPPYLLMTHGKIDDAVNISSANRLFEVLRAKKYGYSFNRHGGGHSGENFLRLDWLFGFRKNQSYPAFTNNSTDITSREEQYNFLSKIGWQPASIKDQANQYEIILTGTGTVDVTPRRLQNFMVPPNTGFHFWLNSVSGLGRSAVSDANGLLTLSGVAVSGATTLIIKPDVVSPDPRLQASPAALAFGSVLVGQPASVNLTITNTGSAALSLTGLAISGAQASYFAFTAPGALPYSLAPSASATVPVTFTPPVTGAASATLTLASNDPLTPALGVALSGQGYQPTTPALSVAPASLAFGNAAIGVATAPANLALSNTGGSPLIISALTLSGAQAAEFALTMPLLPLTLAPSASVSVPVRFTPAALGVRSAGMNIASNQTSGNVTVTLSGTGVTVIPSTVRVNAGGGAFTDDSGHVWSPDNYFNTGGTFTTSSPIVGTVNDALYQRERYDAAGDPELTYSIPVTPGAYKVRLHFAEIYFTSPGQRAFDISIENQIVTANFDIVAQASAKNKALVKEYDVTVADKILSIMLIHKIENPKISGIEVLPGAPAVPAPKLKVSPAALAFGSVLVGQPASLNLTLTNTGSAALSLTGLAISGVQASYFAFTAPGALPFSLAPSASATVPVAFRSPVLGAAAATLTLASNDPLTPALAVALSGQGYQPAPPPMGSSASYQTSGTAAGGTGGHAFLNVVIESDTLAVDYDGDGMETMHFNGQSSHTDQPGRTLLRHQWDVDGYPQGDATAVDIDVPEGDHLVGLTIDDSNTPPASLYGSKHVKVAPIDLIPGTQVMYYPAATPVTLLDAPPAKAAWAAMLPTPSLTLGASPVSAPYMATFRARILLAATGRYTFAATGGSGMRLFINGVLATGPVTLPAGLADLEARFAVKPSDSAPLVVACSLGLSAPEPLPASMVFHDETDLPPVVNTFTAQGEEAGFPVDLTGMGFFPKTQVQVKLGAQVFQGSALQVTPTTLRFIAPAGTGEAQGTVVTPNGTSLPFTIIYISGTSIRAGSK